MQKPPANKNIAAQSKVVQQFYTGPLPDPKSLREYDQFMPGLAERIIKMAELEQACKIKAIEQDQNRNSLIVSNTHEENMSQIKAGARFVYALIILGFCFVAFGFYIFIKTDNLLGLCIASPSLILYLAYGIKYIFPSRR